MVRIGTAMTDRGWMLRSGGATGADTAFHQGVLKSSRYPEILPEIYLSWSGMGGMYPDPSQGLIDSQRNHLWQTATEIALQARGSFNGLGRGGIAHHTRNVFQVLGSDLRTPSRMLVCWARPIGRRGNVAGGTNTAVQIALKYNVPVRNLYYPEVIESVETWLSTQ